MLARFSISSPNKSICACDIQHVAQGCTIGNLFSDVQLTESTFDTLTKYANSYCEIYQANILSQARPSADREWSMKKNRGLTVNENNSLIGK
jgi:hypothetical protein